MKLYVDENIEREIVDTLRATGHDVFWVVEQNPGGEDPDHLAEACRLDRLLITYDYDFGALVFRDGHPAGCGVIHCRIKPADPIASGRRLIEVLAEAEGHLRGRFTTIRSFLTITREINGG